MSAGSVALAEVGAARRKALARMLRPGAIGVFGASDDENSLAYRFTAGLRRHGYPGAVFAISEAASTIDGYPVFRDARDLPQEIDCAVLAVAPERLEQAAAAAAAAGAAGAIVFSSGRESEGGAEHEERLVALCRAHGMILMGPNSSGFINTAGQVCAIASSLSFRERMTSGSVGLVVQGGGVAGIIGERILDLGIGISYLLVRGGDRISGRRSTDAVYRAVSGRAGVGRAPGGGLAQGGAGWQADCSSDAAFRWCRSPCGGGAHGLVGGG
jgi:acyl-CoA synthetase (NDP forming)